MESLIFAIAAARHLPRREETVLDETETLQPFDVQSLRYVFGATRRSASRPNGRNNSNLAQAVS
jgi:hypothetical protein